MDARAETSVVAGPAATGVGRPSVFELIESAATFGVGPLPHRSAGEAARFSFEAFDVPVIPSLPRRSPAESPVAQALSGVQGVSGGQFGAVAIERGRLDPAAPVVTDLASESFVGFKAFLDEAMRRSYVGPIKWQFAGPVGVGAALVRAGVAPEIAFELAAAVIAQHLRALAEEVDAALPGTRQLVVLDEPLLGGFWDPDAPVDPEGAIDVLSSVMASVEDLAATGVHTCRGREAFALLEAGPQLLSLPVSESVLTSVGRLEEFLQRDGWIAWGAVTTQGPIGVTSTRSWHQLSMLWCELVKRGCDADRLRHQSLLTPQCGLGAHSAAVAERVCLTVRDVSRSVRSSAAAARLLLGG